MKDEEKPFELGAAAAAEDDHQPDPDEVVFEREHTSSHFHPLHLHQRHSISTLPALSVYDIWNSTIHWNVAGGD